MLTSFKIHSVSPDHILCSLQGHANNDNIIRGFSLRLNKAPSRAPEDIKQQSLQAVQYSDHPVN